MDAYEGLPQSRVLDISQTPDGYLWIATRLGWLARFDGRNFVNFNPDNTPELVSPELQKLIMDDAGTLWIADIDGNLISYSDGIFQNRLKGQPEYNNRITGWLGHVGNESRFVTASGGILRLTIHGQTFENETNPASIRQYCQDTDGVLWCCTTSGVLGRWTKGQFQPESEQADLQASRVNHLLADDSGGLWIASDNGLWKREKDTFHRVLPSLPESELKVQQLVQNADGGLWLRTSNNLILVKEDTIIHTSSLVGFDASPPHRQIEMHADSKGGVWVIKYGSGVWNVDSDGIATALSTRNGLPDNQVKTWFEDREKNIWLGTAGGLVRLRPRWFDVIQPGTATTRGSIVSIGEDEEGNIWLGRSNGLSRWRNGISEDIPLPSLRRSFPIADVTVAPAGISGQVWLGTVQSGAMLLRDGRIEHPFPALASGRAIRVIRTDPEGGVWMGGEFGLFRWNGKSLRQFGPKDGLSPGHIHDISFDDRGNVWIAKADDLLVIYRNGHFAPVTLPGVSHNIRIYTVLCGADGDVFLGTVGAGLFQLTGGKLLHYTTDDGLPGSSVSQLLIDDDHFLWGGTHRGLFRVSTSALNMRAKGIFLPFIFQPYDSDDGLPSAECSGGLQPACKKTRDGRLWFSTAVGALRVDPQKVTKNIYPPKVIIEQMKVKDQALVLDRINDDPARHVISSGHHRFEFQFAGLSFTNPEKIGFQWRMSKVDKDWVDGGSQRSVAYSGLLPGDYRFSVRARIDVTDTIPNHRLEADVRHHLFLIAKEALHNVAKHSDTNRVWSRSDDRFPSGPRHAGHTHSPPHSNHRLNHARNPNWHRRRQPRPPRGLAGNDLIRDRDALRLRLQHCEGRYPWLGQAFTSRGDNGYPPAVPFRH